MRHCRSWVARKRRGRASPHTCINREPLVWSRQALPGQHDASRLLPRLSHAWLRPRRPQFNFALVVPEAGTAPGQCGSCPGGALANLNCRAWNATPACCATTQAHTGAAAVSAGDATYLNNVITAVIAKFPIDEQRIYVAGEDAGCVGDTRLRCLSSSGA
jgi:hypothetical protein